MLRNRSSSQTINRRLNFMHELFPQTNINGEQSELGAVLTILMFILSFMLEDISETLHIIAITISILVGLGTLLINRKKYKEEFLKTRLYKYLKNAFKKTK